MKKKAKQKTKQKKSTKFTWAIMVKMPKKRAEEIAGEFDKAKFSSTTIQELYKKVKDLPKNDKDALTLGYFLGRFIETNEMATKTEALMGDFSKIFGKEGLQV